MNNACRPGKTPRVADEFLALSLAALTTLSIGTVATTEAAAQVQTPERVTFAAAQYERQPPDWVAHFTILSANAVVGGLTAGIGQKLQGGSFEDGFTRGFLGGTVVYAGKRVAAEDFPGSGLLGRGVAGVGASVVRNALDGRPSLDRMILPLGPARIHVQRGVVPATRIKLDLNTLVMTGVALAKDGLEFDAAASLSAGAPVFNAPGRLIGTSQDTLRASGKVVENVILLSDLPWRTRREAREIFAHERVHVIQREQLFLTIAEPIGARLVERVPGLPRVYDYFDIHFTDLLFALLALPFSEYDDRPWEMEAFRLTNP